MKFTVKYNPCFFDDVAQAVDWYNQQKSGLGDRFFNVVKKQTSKLSNAALLFAIRYDDIRCMSIMKFPYLVHYRVDERTKTINVEALFHTSREPDLWNKRIQY